jgi:hypothetical protein
MIDTLFWFTGLAVWVWIVFICLMVPVVAVENRLMIKRGPDILHSSNSSRETEGD